MFALNPQDEIATMYDFLSFTVGDYMTPNPVTISPQATLAEAQEQLERLGVNGLPVVDAGGAFVGIVTTMDVMRAFANPTSSLIPPYEEIMRRSVESAMTRKPITIAPEVPLSRVLGFLVQKGIRCLPVCTEDGKLVGIVSREDVLRGLRDSVKRGS